VNGIFNFLNCCLHTAVLANVENDEATEMGVLEANTSLYSHLVVSDRKSKSILWINKVR
jgi:hypothetical protein